MTERETLIPLPNILSQTNEKKPVTARIEILIREDMPVYCKNNLKNKYRLISFRLLYNKNDKFWEQKGSWAYFLAKNDFDKLTKIESEESASLRIELQSTIHPAAEPLPVKAEAGFGCEYEVFAKMPAEEKIECINTNRQKLDDIARSKHKDKDKVIEALVDTAKDAALINRAILEEAMRMGDDEAKKLTQDLVDSTHEMVKSSAVLITEDIFSSELMNTLVQKSNGTIVQHMTRVYLNGIAFLAYFNHLVSSSSIAQKIRLSFPEKYRSLYHSLLPHLHIDDINLERVFFGNIKAIPPAHLHNWAVGFLIHDVGKAAAVEYHEGEEKYDREIVIDHVKMGYKYAMTKTHYPMEANMIIGYHHEYYGDPAGYGYFRAYLSQYKKQNPRAKMDYCITYEKEPVLDHHALAYFPAKILEIIDVYDSVTDPNRIYRKAMKPEEALAMMREEFIEKKLKIDPILFDIFTAFVEEKYLSNADRTGASKDEQNLPSEEELMLELKRNADFLNEILENRIKY